MTGRIQAAARLLLAAVALAAPAAAADGCPALAAGAQARLAQYLTVKYRLPGGSALTLQQSDLLPNSCLRQLTFSCDWPRVTITVVLSPDGRYAFPGVFDLLAPATRGPVPPPPAAARAAPPSGPAPLAPADFAALERVPGATLGPAAAPVTIVEFSDFECPFCKRLADTLRNDVLPANKGRVRLIYRQFPLPIHPWANAAATMSDCVAAQSADAFWRLNDYFFTHQAEINPGNIAAKFDGFLAGEHELDPARLHSCLASPAAAARVAADVEAGRKLGVRGTPTFYINGEAYTGARSAAELNAAIARLSSGAGK